MEGLSNGFWIAILSQQSQGMLECREIRKLTGDIVGAPPGDSFEAWRYSAASLPHENVYGVSEELRSLFWIHVVLRRTDFLKPYSTRGVLGPRSCEFAQVTGKPHELRGTSTKTRTNPTKNP